MIAFLREVNVRVSERDPAQRLASSIDAEPAGKQHLQFAGVLKELGLNVRLVSPHPDRLDGVFVGDAAVLLPEIAIIGRPCAKSRLSDVELIMQAIGQHRPPQSIVEPATLDGGDVLRIGRTLHVAETSRTNAEGIAQLAGIVRPFGYEVHKVQVQEDVRLKSACSFVPPHFLIANPAWVDTLSFQKLSVIPVDETEPLAANTLTIGRTTLISASYPKTEKRLRAAGIITRSVDVSEFEKTAGGVSCLSLILEPRGAKTEATEPEITPIQLSGVPEPTGPFSQAIVHRGLVYVSPLPPFEPKAARRRRMSVEEQTEHAIRNLSLVLASVGSSLDYALQATVHVSDAKHVEGIDKVYARMFGQHRPARRVLVNPALPAGIAVEIEAVAAVPNGSS